MHLWCLLPERAGYRGGSFQRYPIFVIRVALIRNGEPQHTPERSTFQSHEAGKRAVVDGEILARRDIGIKHVQNAENSVICVALRRQVVAMQMLRMNIGLHCSIEIGAVLSLKCSRISVAILVSAYISLQTRFLSDRRG